VDSLDVEGSERREALLVAELARVRLRIDVARRKRALIDGLPPCERPAKGRGGGASKGGARAKRDATPAERTKPKRGPEGRAGDGPPCKKMKIPDGRRRWDPNAGEFPEGNFPKGRVNYQKYRCVRRKGDGKRCNRQVRTYCACDPCRTCATTA
jgi:hypothetical protein